MVAARKMNHVIAQFYCEKAEEALNTGGREHVMEYLHKAISIDPDCARASLIEGQLLQNDGKFRQAIKVYKRIEQQDAEVLPEAIIPMLACYREIDAIDDYMHYLREIALPHGGITIILTLADLEPSARDHVTLGAVAARDVAKHGQGAFDIAINHLFVNRRLKAFFGVSRRLGQRGAGRENRCEKDGGSHEPHCRGRMVGDRLGIV